jgi:hypothetical protein
VAQPPGEQFPFLLSPFPIADVDAILGNGAVVEFSAGKQYPATRTVFAQILLLVRSDET